MTELPNEPPSAWESSIATLTDVSGRRPLIATPASDRWRAAVAALMRADMAVLVAFPMLKLLVHVMLGAGYGYHRDELYLLACADHLAWGYVDHPPFSVFMLAIVRALAGASIETIRIVPAVCGALTVLVVGLMTRELGGGLFARALAMTTAMAAPFYLALDAYYSMNAFDLLAWTVAAWLLIRILRGGSPRLWIWLGFLMGAALENKISVLWFGGAIFVGLVATPQRALLRTRWPWIGAAIAAVCFMPHVVWQATHHWPTLHFMHDATADKLVRASTTEFLTRQVDGLLRGTVAVCVAGLAFFLLLPAGRALRAMGWTWLAVFIVLAANGASRGAYLAPADSWLLAAGSVAIASWRGRYYRYLRAGLLGVILAEAFVAAPQTIPLFAESRLAAYSAASGSVGRPEERHGPTAVPEFLAHMSGWPQIVRGVASVADRLSAAERSHMMILAPDYGMAAAIDVLGAPLGLPPASSGHNSFWLWGPQPPSPAVAIVIGEENLPRRQWFEEVTLAGETTCEYCMPYENHRSIWIARRPRIPLDALWPRLQMYE